MNNYKYARDIYKKIKFLPIFNNIDKLIKIYNSWYWSERQIKSLTPFNLRPKTGKENYYVIRRYASDMGLGSYIISNLSQINYAIQKGFIPVIDMMNYNSTILEGKHTNTWELYFRQPANSLKQVYKSGMYWLSDGGCKLDVPNDSMEFLLDNGKLKYWHQVFINYCTFNNSMKNYTNDEYNKLFVGKGKVLGVLCRGTDYRKLCLVNHPIQPENSDVIKKAKEVMDQYKCNYIYLATEDYSIEMAFKHAFADKIIVNKRIYKNYEGGFLANTSNNRKNDLYFTNIEYLSSLYLLSKCDCFIAGRTSGTVITMLMNCQYEYTYFWNLGTY